MAHSPEPWKAEVSGIFDANNKAVTGDDGLCPENKHRIVACVNACQGLSDERLVEMYAVNAPIIKSMREGTAWGRRIQEDGTQ